MEKVCGPVTGALKKARVRVVNHCSVYSGTSHTSISVELLALTPGPEVVQLLSTGGRPL
jgi:ethanolamine utilization microcompartment shell protein EutL